MYRTIAESIECHNDEDAIFIAVDESATCNYYYSCSVIDTHGGKHNGQWLNVVAECHDFKTAIHIAKLMQLSWNESR